MWEENVVVLTYEINIYMREMYSCTKWFLNIGFTLFFFFLEKILDSLFVNDDGISLNYIIDGAKGIIGMWLDLDKSIIYFFFFLSQIILN